MPLGPEMDQTQAFDVYGIPGRRAGRLKRLAARNLRRLLSPLNVCRLHRADGLIIDAKRYTTWRILFSITVLMISQRSFVPFAHDSAKASCLVVILPSIGAHSDPPPLRRAPLI